jgi:hypothetical protein
MSYERGNELVVEERFAEAVREYMAALVDSDDPDLHENLGIALWRLGRWRPAARCLLRTLDGDLVSCLFRDGRALDGERMLRVYETAFGPHPEAWKQG